MVGQFLAKIGNAEKPNSANGDAISRRKKSFIFYFSLKVILYYKPTFSQTVVLVSYTKKIAFAFFLKDLFELFFETMKAIR